MNQRESPGWSSRARVGKAGGQITKNDPLPSTPTPNIFIQFKLYSLKENNLQMPLSLTHTHKLIATFEPLQCARKGPCLPVNLQCKYVKLATIQGTKLKLKKFSLFFKVPQFLPMTELNFGSRPFWLLSL
jgi:hypothetical protein